MKEAVGDAQKKTPKQLEKEAKKQAKLEKFKQKQEQKTVAINAQPNEIKVTN